MAAKSRASFRRLFLFVAALCLAEIVLRYILGGLGQDIFFPTHTRMDGILYGVLLAMLYHLAPDRFEQLRSYPFFWLGCLAVSIYLLRSGDRGGWQGALHQDAANLLSISVLLLLYRPRKDRQPHALLYRIVAWIGLYSYGIYLWHVIFIHTMAEFGDRHPRMSRPLLGIVTAILGIAAGSLTTQIIEFPALRLRDRLFPKRIDSAVGIPAQDETSETALAHL